MGMKRDSQYRLFLDSEFAVVGQNYEFADYDNPRGEIIRLRYFMVAEDARGRQVRYGFEDSENHDK